MKSFLTFSVAIVMMCAAAYPQDRGTIQCEPGLNHIVAWTAPGSAWAVDHLSCGQEVSIRGLEKGYYRIQLGSGIGYVHAKYVRLTQVQEQRSAEPTEIIIPQVQVTPAPKPEEPAVRGIHAPQPP